MVHYKLTYFNGRWIAETARQIFAYAGVEFEDVRLPHGGDRAEFNALKPKLPFGQVPIMEVDGKILPQSVAINRFLGRTFGLAGANNWEAAQIDALADGVQEMRKKMIPWFMEEDVEKKKEMLKKLNEEVLKPGFERYEKFLTENGTGYFISWFDINFAETIDNFKELYGDCFQVPSKLLEFAAKIHAHPNLKKWIEQRPKGEF